VADFKGLRHKPIAIRAIDHYGLTRSIPSIDMLTTSRDGRNASNGDLAPHPGFLPEAFVESASVAQSVLPEGGTPSYAELRILPWAKVLASSTTLFGVLYLILYQATREYYGHLGITPDQAGVSQQGLAGGVLEFALLYTGVLLPGILLAVSLFRWTTRSWRVNLELGVEAEKRVEMAAQAAVRTIVPLGAAGVVLIAVLPLIFHNVPAIILFVILGFACGLGAGGLICALVYVELVDRPRTMGVLGYIALPIHIGQTAFEWMRSQHTTTALWVRRRAPWAVGAAVLVVLVFMLWGAADLAGGDVLRRGDSTRNIFDGMPLGRLAPPLPVLDLLGAHPVPVSPCLIDLSASPTPSHLRAAVIVGHSGGRTYIVGVAGSGGFRHAPMGHVVRFSVADSELSAVDLDHPASPWRWDTSERLVAAADTATC